MPHTTLSTSYTDFARLHKKIILCIILVHMHIKHLLLAKHVINTTFTVGSVIIVLDYTFTDFFSLLGNFVLGPIDLVYSV